MKEEEGIVMLVALMDHQYISLTSNYSREQLLQLRKKQKFICPQCKSELQLKIGKVKTPHFAHFRDANCHNLFSEGESETHLLGKLALYDFFKKANKNVVLEPYLATLSQRPDLLVQDRDRTYAIEFQCSTIDLDLVSKRTSGYIQHGIHPYWLLNTSGKYYEETNCTKMISLTKFEQQFILRNGAHSYLLTFHPQTKTFFYYTHLIHFQTNQFIAEIQRLPIQYQTFPFFQPKKMSFSKFLPLIKLYKKRTQAYVENKIYRSTKGVKDILLRSIYELKLNRVEMPIFLGLPTLYAKAMVMVAVEWQTALFYYGRIHQKQVLQFTNYDMKQFLKWLNIDSSDIKIKAVNNYIQLLRELDIEDVNKIIQEQIVFEKLHHHLVAL